MSILREDRLNELFWFCSEQVNESEEHWDKFRDLGNLVSQVICGMQQERGHE